MLLVHVVLLISLSGAIRMACLLAPSALGLHQAISAALTLARCLRPLRASLTALQGLSGLKLADAHGSTYRDPTALIRSFGICSTPTPLFGRAMRQEPVAGAKLENDVACPRCPQHRITAAKQRRREPLSLDLVLNSDGSRRQTIEQASGSQYILLYELHAHCNCNSHGKLYRLLQRLKSLALAAYCLISHRPCHLRIAKTNSMCSGRWSCSRTHDRPQRRTGRLWDVMGCGCPSQVADQLACPLYPNPDSTRSANRDVSNMYPSPSREGLRSPRLAGRPTSFAPAL
jgi:hypothetical protein